MTTYEIHENVDSEIVLLVTPETQEQLELLQKFLIDNGIAYSLPDLEEVPWEDTWILEPDGTYTPVGQGE